MNQFELRCTATLLLAFLCVPLAAQAPPGSAGSRIEGVPGGIEGPACVFPSLTRALNASFAMDLPPDYLRGLSGDAMLATVCQNNCGCRDYREMQLRVLPTLAAIGCGAQDIEQHVIGADESWRLFRESIAAGRPAVVYNLFGDSEDVPLVGIDEEGDLAWGLRSDGSADYGSVTLSKWKSQPLYGYVLDGARRDVNLRQIEFAQLLEAVAAERRPLIDGG